MLSNDQTKNGSVGPKKRKRVEGDDAVLCAAMSKSGSVCRQLPNYCCQCYVMGMSYVVHKKVKGRLYAYLQRSYRVGKRVKTESVYLGAAERMAMATLERENKALDEWQRKTFNMTGRERQEHEARTTQFSQDKFLHDTQQGSDKEKPSEEG